MTTTEATPVGIDEPFHLVITEQPVESAEQAEIQEVAWPKAEDGSLIASWCIDDKDAIRQWLFDNRITEACMLLVVAHVTVGEHGSTRYVETKRQLVPMTTPYVYVPFVTVGHNVLRGTLVWSKGGIAALERVFKDKKPGGEYAQAIIRDNGEFFGSWDYHPDDKTAFNAYRYDHVTTRNVIVDQEDLAKPPPKFEQELFRRFFKRKPDDWCMTFWRRVKFYPLMALYMPLQLVIRPFVLAMSLFFGARDINYQPMIHWCRYGALDILDQTENSIWFHDADGHRRPWWWWIYNPPVLLGLALLLWAGWSSNQKSFQLQQLLVIGGITLSSLVLVAIIGFVVALVYRRTETPERRAVRQQEQIKRAAEVQRRQQAAKQAKQHAEQLQQQRAVEQLVHEVETLDCQAGPRPLTYRQVPKEQRTIRLWLDDHKHRGRCRPYAR